LAQPNVQVLGTQPDYVVEKYMAQAKAFMLLVRILALPQSRLKACGTPVIAYGAGGALETV